MAPAAKVVMSDDELCLFYRIAEFSPDLDLSAAHALYQELGQLLYAMIESAPCYEIRFGQAFADYASAHHCRGSVWRQDLLQACQQYSSTDAQRLSLFSHYIFCFHDEILECIASTIRCYYSRRDLSEFV